MKLTPIIMACTLCLGISGSMVAHASSAITCPNAQELKSLTTNSTNLQNFDSNFYPTDYHIRSDSPAISSYPTINKWLQTNDPDHKRTLVIMTQKDQPVAKTDWIEQPLPITQVDTHGTAIQYCLYRSGLGPKVQGQVILTTDT